MTLSVQILPLAGQPLVPSAHGSSDILAELENRLSALEHETAPMPLQLGMNAVVELLYSAPMLNAIQDPRHQQRLNAIRDRWADAWSTINGRVEQIFTAHNLVLQPGEAPIRLMNAFEETNLFKGSDAEFLQGELTLLEQHIPGLATRSVCHIGCGPLPYTGLHYQPRVGRMTLLDVWPEACRLCHKICTACRLNFHVIESPAEAHDYSQYDVVVMSSMVRAKASVMARIMQNPPHYLVCRSTNLQRPGGLLRHPLSDDLLSQLNGRFLGQTHPPIQVNNLSFLFQLRA